MKRFLALIISALLLAGCTATGPKPSENSPIPADAVPVLLGQKEFVLLRAGTTDEIRRYKLGRSALDWAETPSSFLLPLHEDPEDETASLAVIDKRTGEMRKIRANVGGMNAIHMATDGLAYIVTGTTKGDSFQFLLGRFDPDSGQFLEPLVLPGQTNQVTSLSDGTLLIPIQREDLSGNVFRYDPKTGEMAPLLQADLEPGSTPPILADEKQGLLYALWPGLPKGTTLWENWRDRVSNDHLLDAHIDVFDLKGRALVRRIFLPHLTAQQLGFMADGRVLVGYLDLTQQVAVPAFSVVSPVTGEIKDIPAAGNPASLRAVGDFVYVANDEKFRLEVWRTSDWTKVASHDFPAPLQISPQTDSMKP